MVLYRQPSIILHDDGIDSKLNFTFNVAQREMNVMMSNTFWIWRTQCLCVSRKSKILI
jgi:hypothetical protein